jgi:hypothetical protein
MIRLINVTGKQGSIQLLGFDLFTRQGYQSSMEMKRTDRLQRIFEKLTPEDKAYIVDQLFKDPFSGLYIKAILAYTLILLLLLLYPFDFHLLSPNHVERKGSPAGISFPGNGLVLSPEPARVLAESLKKASGL